MKTYTKTTITEEPMLKIYNDDDAPSPREDDNLGYFITVDSRYISPDENILFKKIIEQTSEEASDQEDHIKRIKGELETIGEKILAIYPVTQFEHGNINYHLGTRRGFDYSNNGFYIVTEEGAKNLGVEEKDFEKVINQELEAYNKYINGETYRFTLYDQNGEEVDSCGGFYNIEDIKSYLPREWADEDLNEYYQS
jgi:hypothetical protein